jgi:hypothetical protein
VSARLARRVYIIVGVACGKVFSIAEQFMKTQRLASGGRVVAFGRLNEANIPKSSAERPRKRRIGRMKATRNLMGLLAAATVASAALPGLSTTAPASEESPLPHGIRIGVLNDRSGPYADATGEGSAVAARMAAEEFRNNVQGQPIEIVVGDHMGKVDLGALVARKWFDTENVDVVVDIANSGVGAAGIGCCRTVMSGSR